MRLAKPSSAAFVLLLCGACSSDPDVVATSRQNGLPGVANVVSDCEEGAYQGAFSTTRSEGTFPLALSGLIGFSLIKSERGGEFLRLGDTKLEGLDPTKNAQFKAIIATGECKEGSYETEINEGRFSFLMADGGALGEPVKFTGTIRGEYILQKHTFFGEWETTTEAGLNVSGRWSAFLVDQ